MAEVADPRLDALAQVVSAQEGDAGRAPRPGRARAPGRRCSGTCARSTRCSSSSTASRRAPIRRGDLENLKLELLVADRDHVAGRLERVEKQAKSGDPKLRAEVERLREVLAAVDAGTPLSEVEGELPDGLEPLTTKPLIAVENGPGGIDLALEAELAELADEEAAAFRDGGALGARGGRPAAARRARPDHVLHRRREGDARLAAPPRARRRSTPPATIHSDIARGFIRCEVVDWQDLVEAGSHAEVSRRGQQRLEGKTYVVRDGDVLNIRFNV